MEYKTLLILVSGILLLFNAELNAQTNNNDNCNTIKPIHINNLIVSSNAYIQNNLPNIEASERKVKKLLLENYTYLNTVFNNKEVIKNTTVDQEINVIVSKIIDANPTLNAHQFNILYALDYKANAASLGNNIFFIYPGLFEILENDAQLTFIICHEIAHQLLHHFEYSIAEHIRLNKTDLNNQTVLDRYRDKREFELRADALGFKLYSNLNYPKSQAIQALVNLKNSDSILFSKNIDLKSQFNFKEYPFKSFWLNNSKQLITLKKYTSNFRNLDSLRTHPNIDVRVEAIKSIEITKQDPPTTTLTNHITKIKQWQDANYLCAISNNNKYDLHLFLALEKHYENPDNIFAAEVIATTLLEIYSAKKEKQFSKYIPPPNAFTANTTFTELKMFLKNTEAREIRKIGLAFCNAQTQKSDKLIRIQDHFKRLNK